MRFGLTSFSLCLIPTQHVVTRQTHTQRLRALIGQQEALVRTRAAYNRTAFATVVTAREDGELSPLAVHADSSLGVWDPNRGVLGRWLLAAAM